MIRKMFGGMIMGVALCFSFGFHIPAANGAPFKVLVVMSYEETYPWCRDIREGIDHVFSDSHEINYFYMNTKFRFNEGPQKAKEAYNLYQALKPDGVIVADDNAQSMFVVPYLKDKVKTPVMFCGVNAKPEKYGYPASNVSGILERIHVSESIAFAQQLKPSIKTVGFIAKDSPVIRMIAKQVSEEHTDYTAQFIAFKMPKTKEETLTMAQDFKSQCDLLFMETLQGVTDGDGRPLEDKEIMPMVADAFKKPIITSNKYAVQYAALCAVVKTGQEQGEAAARMLLKAMKGTPVDRIPIITNKYGKRIINVTVMKKMGIKPKPIILQGAELVRTEE